MNSQLNRRFLLFLIVWLAISSSAYAANIIDSKYRWKKTNIKVCFLDSKVIARSYLQKTHYYSVDNLIGPLTNANWWSYAKQTKDLVNKHYTKISTGVHFTGWLPCSITKNANAQIFFFKTTVPSTSFSDAGSYPFKSIMAINVGPFISLEDAALNKNYAEGFFTEAEELKKDAQYAANQGNPQGAQSLLKMAEATNKQAEEFMEIAKFDENSFGSTVLHEFGHLAGLHHRLDYLLKEKCITSNFADKSEKTCKTNITAPSLAKPYGPYDLNSIMSYCNTRKMNANKAPIQLSPLDKAALKFLFKGLPEN